MFIFGEWRRPFVRLCRRVQLLLLIKPSVHSHHGDNHVNVVPAQNITSLWYKGALYDETWFADLKNRLLTLGGRALTFSVHNFLRRGRLQDFPDCTSSRNTTNVFLPGESFDHNDLWRKNCAAADERIPAGAGSVNKIRRGKTRLNKWRAH